MNSVVKKKSNVVEDLIPITVRIRKDQRNRLQGEQRARGSKLADVVRDNLDLAFAMKEELSKIVEGELDECDPTNPPRLVHSLLFRFEERILAGLDNLSNSIVQQFALIVGRAAQGPDVLPVEQNRVTSGDRNCASTTVDEFISLIADTDDHPREIWLGAFLEIVPRLDLVGISQLNDLKAKGEKWLRDHQETNRTPNH